MSYIEAKHLNKTFKVAKKEKGLKGSIKAFFKRDYKYIKAVNDISFSIKKGEIVGYIGPNGAGKSTTIKMLSGILVPDSGTCTISKMVPWHNRKEYVKKIGVVFGQRSQLWWDIPPIDSFDLLRDIYELDYERYEKTKEELVDRLEIKEILNVPVRQLSLGQRMRCEIVASLLHEPEILFLDEPTIGLDAISKIIVRDFIKEINKEKNVTIILTTHDMSDIESLAKRIILIGKGTVLYDGSLLKLKNKYVTKAKISIFTKETLTYEGKGVESRIKTDYGYDYIIDIKTLKISDFLNKISGIINIDDIEIQTENIDDVIVKLYKEFEI